MDRETSDSRSSRTFINRPTNQNATMGPLPPDGYNPNEVQNNVSQPVQPEQDQLPSPTKKSKMGKIGLLVGIVIVVIALVAILVMVFDKKASGNKNSGSSDSAGPKVIANAFIDDLQQGNTASAYHLESTNFQNLSDKQVELSDPSKYVPNVQTTMTGTATGVDKGQNVAEVAYRLDNGTKPLYVELTLEENNGIWQVDGFDSAYSPLTPNI